MGMRILGAGVACAAALMAGHAAAASSPEELCKGGQLANVRINTLKTPQSREAYEQAARDHIGWYRKHGHKDNRLLVGPVLLFDRATGQWSESPSEFASLHLNNTRPVPASERDAAWDAYVAAYRATSDLATDKFVCLKEPVK